MKIYYIFVVFFSTAQHTVFANVPNYGSFADQLVDSLASWGIRLDDCVTSGVAPVAQVLIVWLWRRVGGWHHSCGFVNMSASEHELTHNQVNSLTNIVHYRILWVINRLQQLFMPSEGARVWASLSAWTLNMSRTRHIQSMLKMLSTVSPIGSTQPGITRAYCNKTQFAHRTCLRRRTGLCRSVTPSNFEPHVPSRWWSIEIHVATCIV